MRYPARTDITPEMVAGYFAIFPEATDADAAEDFHCSEGTIARRKRKLAKMSRSSTKAPKAAVAPRPNTTAQQLAAVKAKHGIRANAQASHAYNPNHHLVFNKRNGTWMCAKVVDGKRHYVFTNIKDLAEARQVRDSIFNDMGW